MLGVTIVAVGVISLVAANWSAIPAGVKLAADFALLCCLALCLCRFGDGSRPAVFDAIAAFFILFCLASIGLIAQIYHTGGYLYQALLLWCAITLPLSLFAHKKFIPHLWAAALIGATAAYCFHEARHDEAGIYRLALLWSMPLWAFLAGLFSRRVRPLAVLAEPLFFWACLTCLAATAYFDIAHSSGLILQGDAHPARLFHYQYYAYGDAAPPATVLYGAISLLGLAAAAALGFTGSIDKKTRILLCLVAVLFCIMMNSYGLIDYGQFKKQYGAYGSHYPLLLKLVGPAVHIAMLLLLSFLFAGLGRQRLFNLLVNLIGLRFLIIYFQVFGSLATTGLGLIISGLVIIGAVVGWYRCRRQVQAWLGGLLR
jgi:uncharacterized membrane protein